MNVSELTRDQLVSLKCDYMAELVNEGSFAEIMDCDHDEPSWWDCIHADELISDEFIMEHYEGISFTEDDFIC